MRFLGHRYPRVRRWTAEQTYIKLLEDSSVIPNTNTNTNTDNVDVDVDAATTLLCDIMWDQELGPPANVRDSRNRVADLLGIQLSDKERLGPAPTSGRSPRDEYESYASLVREAGR